jgi:serine/threonine protein phosphatase PrpC
VVGEEQSMSTDLLLGCPVCGAAGLAGDTFCEACGAEIAAARDAARHHNAIDRGTVAGITDRGLVHRRNDDAVHVESTGTGAVLAVCDGVSASTGPEVAAQVAAEELGRSVAEALRRGPDSTDGWDPEGVVREAIGRAVDTVVAIPWMDDGSRDAPSCTVVLAVWDGADLTVGWLGDSRAYWVDEDGCRQLTVDHSWAEEQVSAGRLDRASADADSRAHAITRWAGADAPPGPCPIASLRPRQPGRVIVCTDGLWNYAPMPDDLARLVVAHGDATPLALARSLVRHALARGGHDNVTVAVADIVPAITIPLEGA